MTKTTTFMCSQRIRQLLERKENLTEAEEYEVFCYYGEHKSIELRNMIVIKNARLAYFVAAKYQHSAIEWEELCQEGLYGLCISVDKFDPEKRCKFSTYAIYWITQVITRYIQNNGKLIRVPVNKYLTYHEITQLQKEYEAEYGECPDTSFIAKKIGKPEQSVKDIISIFEQSFVSLNKTTENEEGSETEIGEFIEDPDSNKEYQAIDNESLYCVLQEHLTPKEYDVLCQRYGLNGNPPKTLEEIGETYHVSRERIRQIEKKAFKKLNMPSAKKELMDFNSFVG